MHSHKVIISGREGRRPEAFLLSSSHPVNVYDPGPDWISDLKDWPPCWLTAWWFLLSSPYLFVYCVSNSSSLTFSPAKLKKKKKSHNQFCSEFGFGRKNLDRSWRTSFLSLYVNICKACYNAVMLHYHSGWVLVRVRSHHSGGLLIPPTLLFIDGGSCRSHVITKAWLLLCLPLHRNHWAILH